MKTASISPDINKSALIIVDMQNDFLHREGNFSHIAREHPEFEIDIPFLIGTIPSVKRLAEAFRAAGGPVASLEARSRPRFTRVSV
jgi:ureidoacrylate peracid hydrolase